MTDCGEMWEKHLIRHDELEKDKEFVNKVDDENHEALNKRIEKLELGAEKDEKGILRVEKWIKELEQKVVNLYSGANDFEEDVMHKLERINRIESVLIKYFSAKKGFTLEEELLKQLSGSMKSVPKSGEAIYKTDKEFMDNESTDLKESGEKEPESTVPYKIYMKDLDELSATLSEKLIREFIKDLENIDHWSIEGLEITPMNEIRGIKEKWEGRLK